MIDRKVCKFMRKEIEWDTKLRQTTESIKISRPTGEHPKH